MLADVWGSSGSGAGELATPTGLDTDAYDNVYVADYDNNRVQKFSPDGELLLTWGGFNGPKDVAVDSGNGFVYVADEKNHQIKKFTLVHGDWLPGGDELTPTMKLKRKPIAEKYGAEIEAMYAR